MKLIVIVVLAMVAVSHAVDEPIKIIRSEFEQKPEGYEAVFETANGIVRSETGQLKEVKDEEQKPHQVVVVRGSWSYTDPEGKPETISFYADETGYHPEGESIPKAPASRR